MYVITPDIGATILVLFKLSSAFSYIACVCWGWLLVASYDYLKFK